jgi:hypothetical protein
MLNFVLFVAFCFFMTLGSVMREAGYAHELALRLV